MSDYGFGIAIPSSLAFKQFSARFRYWPLFFQGHGSVRHFLESGSLGAHNFVGFDHSKTGFSVRHLENKGHLFFSNHAKKNTLNASERDKPMAESVSVASFLTCSLMGTWILETQPS